MHETSPLGALSFFADDLVEGFLNDRPRRLSRFASVMVTKYHLPILPGHTTRDAFDPVNVVVSFLSRARQRCS